jgi:hypothetical protein
MIEATFFLISCDNQCGVEIALRTDQEWEAFERDWYAGVMYQFCPDCKNKIETQSRQMDDEYFLEVVKNYGGESDAVTSH